MAEWVSTARHPGELSGEIPVLIGVVFIDAAWRNRWRPPGLLCGCSYPYLKRSWGVLSNRLVPGFVDFPQWQVY